MKKPYVPNLIKFSHLCEINYYRLESILGGQTGKKTLSLDDYSLLHFEFLDLQKFTRTLLITQTRQNYLLPNFKMKVQIYEDVKMAEVISYQNQRHFLGNYDYPNKRMHQPDEKYQLNELLKEILLLCLQQSSSKEFFSKII